MKRNPNSPHSQYIRAIVLVKGVHFYGFHSAYSPFLKVYINDPSSVNRAVTLLQSGTIMKTRFRVFESHLSFILQFLCDFGLYGCGWIDLAETWQRGQDEDAQEQEEPLNLKASPYYRQTRMPLELDVAAHQILNRHRLSPRDVHHQLTIPAPPLSAEPVVLSVRELWDDERERRLARGLAPTPVVPRDVSERSRGAGADWVQEARWWDELRKKISREKDIEQPLKDDAGWERWVMTTFESVEALWPSKYRTWKPRRDDAVVEQEANPYEADAEFSQDLSQPEVAGDVDIDEDMLASQELSRMVEREELEWAEREGDLQEDGRPDGEDEAMEEDLPGDLLYGEQTPGKNLGTPSRYIHGSDGRSKLIHVAGVWMIARHLAQLHRIS